mmetsp:Transcript_3394/g.5098  ORF Transcript_3394/g.5098 Transcript_3394/m.5098 type:complete len:108 (-) Transcript_3394:252-575(-)
MTVKMDHTSMLSPMIPHKPHGAPLNLKKLEEDPEPTPNIETKDDLKRMIRDHFDKLQKDLDFDSVGIQGALQKKKKKFDMNKVQTIHSEEEDSKMLEDVSAKSDNGR